MKIVQTIAGLFLVLFSVSAWHLMGDASFWNLSHTVAFTVLPVIGVWLLWRTAEEAIESL